MKLVARVLATAALTAGLGVAVPAVVAAPAGADFTCGFGAGNATSVPIPDNGTATSTQDLTSLADNDPIIDLDVIINITHPFDGDLIVSLSSRGQTALLVNRRGSNGHNFADTWFDDGVTSPISSGTAPFTGSFRPEESLNAFDDLDPGGIWTLRITDAAGGDVGTLTSWQMIMQTRWCDDFDRDTVRQDVDQCPGMKGARPHGCPIRNRTVSLTYNNAAQEFRGVLRCPAAIRCATVQPVRVYRIRSGPDALIRRTFTNANGNFVVPRARMHGNYYAIAPRVYEEAVAECKRATSATLTL
jgi:subtilisin-like proprotein convertase family protein